MTIETVLLSEAVLISLAYEVLFGNVFDALFIFALTLWREREILPLRDLLGDEPILPLVIKSVFAISVASLWFLSRLKLILDLETPKWEGLGKPLLIPARTTHRRVFPEKHAFSYSYLVVGVPVGWHGPANGMISTDVSSKDGKGSGTASSSSSLASLVGRAWFHVAGADHLKRGAGSLETKLQEYLESQGVNPKLYPHAYLVTAASFLGYNFNPVSFWYLYNESKEFKAMILEVNNTFGERRMYLLEATESTSDSSSSEIDGGDHANGAALFKHHWKKDFHVSPFNSRKGAYTLRANDILDDRRQGLHRLDGTITLSSSKEHAKIVARLFNDGAAVDPNQMNAFSKTRFILGWFWVGFVTFPRIVKEAAILFFRRKLHVWYRPEPLKESLGRVADDAEEKLAGIFRAYLRHLVSQATDDLVVSYIPSSGDGKPEVMRSPSTSSPSSSSSKAKALATEETTDTSNGTDDDHSSKPATGTTSTLHATPEETSSSYHLTFQVLTPAFYARFVHYAHDFEAVFAEFRANQTIHVSRPELLPKLFVTKSPSPTLSVANPRDFLCFSAVKRLRQLPERIERPLTSSAASSGAPSAGDDTATHTVRDVRGFRISSMDGWVLSQASPEMRAEYGSLVLRVLLAERIAFGFMGLLWLEEMALRVGFAWCLASVLGNFVPELVALIDWSLGYEVL